jgi:hypothetical protein
MLAVMLHFLERNIYVAPKELIKTVNYEYMVSAQNIFESASSSGTNVGR